MLPLGDYLLRIAPAATRVTANKTKMQNVPTLLAISMVVAMRRYYTTRITKKRRFVAFIKATKRHHWASTHSDMHHSDMPTPIPGVYFIIKSLKKSSSCPSNNRGVTYQTDEKHLNNMSRYFLGWLKQYLTVLKIIFYDVSITNNHLKYL
jgi:hypothetical protein